MKAGGIAVVLALLLIGAAGGYVAAQELREEPTGSGAAAPLAAREPAYPADPEPRLRPSSDRPALDPRMRLEDAQLGRPGNRIAIRVPSGWTANPALGRQDEIRWDVPGSTGGLHSVRVEVLDANESPYQMVVGRAAMLQADARLSNLVVRTDLGLVTDTIEYDYDIARYHKRSIVRFVELDGSGQADLEIAWTGRPELDQEGMLTLTERMAASARRIG